MKGIILRPIAAWNVKAIMAYFPDGRQRIESALAHDVYVEMLGSISVRLDWRDRKKPTDGSIFTRKGISINDVLMTITEPQVTHIGRSDRVHSGTTLDRLIRFEGLPSLPAIPISGGRHRNGDSDYIFGDNPNTRMSEILI